MAHSRLSGRPFGLTEKRERYNLAQRVWMDTLAGGWPAGSPPATLAEPPAPPPPVEQKPPVKKTVAKKKVVTKKK